MGGYHSRKATYLALPPAHEKARLNGSITHADPFMDDSGQTMRATTESVVARKDQAIIAA